MAKKKVSKATGKSKKGGKARKGKGRSGGASSG
jgi:hypothetical protein